MAHRGIATLAFAITVCFLLLGHFDAQFFLIHFYESLIYLVIVLMLFYSQDRWACMLGILAPASWLFLTIASGGLNGIFREMGQALRLKLPDSPANSLGAMASLLSVLMILLCAYHWKREYAGHGKNWGTFGASLAVVIGYYAVLVLWFLRWLPAAS